MQTLLILFLFFFNDTATTEIYTLSLHDALPISFPRRERLVLPPADSRVPRGGRRCGRGLTARHPSFAQRGSRELAGTRSSSWRGKGQAVTSAAGLPDMCRSSWLTGLLSVRRCTTAS